MERPVSSLDLRSMGTNEDSITNAASIMMVMMVAPATKIMGMKNMTSSITPPWRRRACRPWAR